MLNDLLPAALAIALLGNWILLSAVSLDGTDRPHSSSKGIGRTGHRQHPAFLPRYSRHIRHRGSATNVKNGAKTRLSAIVHSVLMLLVLVVAAAGAVHPHAGFGRHPHLHRVPPRRRQ